MKLLNEPTLFHKSEMPAHRGGGQPKCIGKFACPARLLSKQLDDATTISIRQGLQSFVERSPQSSRLFVVKPLALSHSAGVIFFTVTLKVQK